MEGFKYVVNPPAVPKVVFGSSLPREALPSKGPCLSSFMRSIQGDADRSPGPTAYVDKRNYMEIHWPSTFGYTAFANEGPRLMVQNIQDTPPIGAYSVDVHICKRKNGTVYKPFGSGSKRDEKPSFLTPAPGSYPYHISKPKPEISTAFMTQRKIQPSVLIVCSPENVAKCVKCGQKPVGDYWRNMKTNVDMCRMCMNVQKSSLHSCSTKDAHRLRIRHELENYKKARHCSFFHDHKGTAAAIQLITVDQLKRKIKLENYLSAYLKN